MLHDPGSISHPRHAETINLSVAEKDTPKRPGEQLSEIAALPIHRDKAVLWCELDRSRWVRPKNMRGFSNTQIFSDVSPQVNWELRQLVMETSRKNL